MNNTDNADMLIRISVVERQICKRFTFYPARKKSFFKKERKEGYYYTHTFGNPIGPFTVSQLNSGEAMQVCEDVKLKLIAQNEIAYYTPKVTMLFPNGITRSYQCWTLEEANTLQKELADK